MAPTLDFTQFRAEDGSNTKRRIIGIYTGPASYATGGDPFVAADVKLGQIDVLLMGGSARNSSSTLRLLSYDRTNNTVVWVVPNTGSEVANGTDLSGFTAGFEAIGR